MIPKSQTLMIDQEVETRLIPTTEDLIDSKENRPTLRIEIKTLRKLTITEDLIDSRENQPTLRTEIKILRKLAVTEEKKVKNLFHNLKALPKH